jgi:hypothetical protein
MMLNPLFLYDEFRIRRSLRKYPAYSPPKPGMPALDLNVLDGEENYKYFIENKGVRINCLAKFLEYFGASISIVDTNIHIVDLWMQRYSGYLLRENSGANYISSRAFHPAWRGDFAGLNVIWDIGIFAGDCAIRINPNCAWFFNDGRRTRDGKDLPDYLFPCIMNNDTGDHIDILGAVFEIVRVKHRALHKPSGVWGLPNAGSAALENCIDRAARKRF